MEKSYSVLGKYFEYLNADCDYLTWSQYLLNKIKLAGKYSSGLDIGCGNGYFTRAFNKAGYAVDGMDISESMLTVAQQKAAAEGVRCRFFKGDIKSFKLLQKVDFCTAVNDCINYIPKDKLKTAFTRIYAALNRGGAFFFDISSAYKLRRIIGENTFCEDSENLSYIWFNEQFAGGVKMSLTFFIKSKNGLYERCEETHVQYAHEEEDIIAALEGAGFTNISAEGHLGGDKNERIQFSAFKR